MSKHPKGLMILFFTDMWERFSYYGMNSILVLFLVSDIRGGFGWDDGKALTLLGVYSMMVYMMSIPGGMIADRFLGQRKAVMIGGALLCAGHLMMAWPARWTFYTALGLLVLGVGLLKPNITTLVAGLYPEGDPRQDSGFTIYYMGANLGSLMAIILISYVGEKIDWHLGFSIAGLGMVLGQSVFIYGQKHLTQTGKPPVKKSSEQTRHPFSPQEKDRIKVLGLVFLVMVVFCIAFEQAAGLLTLYAAQYTDRNLWGFEVPASMFRAFNAGFILIFGSVVAGFWIRISRDRVIPSLFKMGVGIAIVGLGYLFMVGASFQRTDSGQSAMYWLIGTYLMHTLGELCLAPVALSFMTRLAPKRMMATVMGLFWAVWGLSNLAASQIGKLADTFGELAIFLGLLIFCVLFGLLLVSLSRWITTYTHGADIHTSGE